MPKGEETKWNFCSFCKLYIGCRFMWLHAMLVHTTYTYNGNRLIAGDCKQIENELTRTRFGRCPRTDRYGTIVSARSVYDDVERFWFLWLAAYRLYGRRLQRRHNTHFKQLTRDPFVYLFMCAFYDIKWWRRQWRWWRRCVTKTNRSQYNSFLKESRAYSTAHRKLAPKGTMQTHFE